MTVESYWLGNCLYYDCRVVIYERKLLKPVMTSGQSYKHFMLVNYDSRGVATRELPILRFVNYYYLLS